MEYKMQQVEYGKPWQVLGEDLKASAQEIREVYLDKIRLYPPDRCPEQFEKIRDAYELLKNPKKRIETMILAANPRMPLVELVKNQDNKRHFVSSAFWTDVLKQKTT